MTDFHYDSRYEAGGSRAEMCHGKDSNDETVSGWGDFKCDSPWKLIQSGIDMLKMNFSDPDFIIWTGYVSSIKTKYLT